MEELNEKQENVQNEVLQSVAEQPAADNDTNTTNTNPEPAPETENEPEPEMDCSAMSREELLEALKTLLEEDVAKIRNRVSAIRAQFTTLNKEVEKAAYEAFLAEGGNKEDYKAANDQVADEFFKLFDIYRNRRLKMQEEIDAQKLRNLEAKRQILEELRVLISKDEETLKQTYDDFNAIQDKWKEIGDVPREQMNDLWQNYHFLIEQFFNKVKINKELRMLDLKRNLEQKIQLCERAEELIVETSVVKAFKSLQELRSKWKEIGPVPQEQNEEIWQRFNNAANKIDERRQEYYDQRKEELDQNLLAKQALIAKAEELTQQMPTSTKQWNDTTEALDGLLKLWKSIGTVPREQNEEIWSKFKGIIDKHYTDKKEHFGKMRDEQAENYNRKLDLCLKAEAIAKREDWKKATEELLQLQAEWKTIGATSRKVSDKVWLRFRSACDEFFAKKGEFFKDIRSSEGENLTKKQAIIEEIKAHVFGDNKDENLAAVKDFQRRWSEIGHVPMSEKDRVQKEYRGLIDHIFEQLKISAREAEENNYRARVRNFSGDTKKFVNNERQELQDRIEKFRSDIKLWENNLGFLASSKQADLLKEEFERKMQAARQQIALLQAKLRILDETNEQE
ncbi:MAG: DUF349 domain-containing protein [Bacteroidales bacterium]|nr:DUF349 domain-containing protein [Bacteroidales bacterium]